MKTSNTICKIISDSFYNALIVICSIKFYLVQKRLNVLVVTVAFPSQFDPVDGIFVKEMSKCISQNHNVKILYCRTVPKDTNSVGIIESTIDGLDVVNVFVKKGPLPNMVYTSLGLLKGISYLQKQNHQFDIIHANYFASAIPFLIKMKKIPIVLSEHWSGFPLKLLPWYTALIAKKVFKHCRVVCPDSEYLMRSIRSYGIEADFRILYNPVDTDIFCLSEKKDEKKIKPLIIARQDPVKGIPFLLESVKLVAKERKDFHLDIVGGGPKLDEYTELANSLGITNFVTFHGTKTKLEVSDFLKSCDFMVLSSLTENEPVVVNEAMCCGKPILATKVGGIPEIVDDSIGILVESQNPSSMKNGFISMLDNFKKFDPIKISEKGKILFSYSSISKSINEIYEKIMKQ